MATLRLACAMPKVCGAYPGKFIKFRSLRWHLQKLETSSTVLWIINTLNIEYFDTSWIRRYFSSTLFLELPILEFRTTHFPTRTGHYRITPVILPSNLNLPFLLLRFLTKLEEISKIIAKRNETRPEKYPYLDPKEIPNAISI